MQEIERCFFDDRDAMFNNLADHLITRLNQGLTERNTASMVVPGGSTPGPLFAALAARDLDWSRVTVTTSDERWVPDHDPACNAEQVRESLLVGEAAEAKLIPLTNDADDPETGEVRVREALMSIPRPFDAVVLGMGTDGHTASLFPGGDNLLASLADHAVPVHAIRAPGAPQPRITLTLPTLLDAREVILLITGDEKRRVFGQALTPGPIEDMPVRAVLHQHQTPVRIYWSP